MNLPTFAPPVAVVLIAAVVVPFMLVMGVAGWYSIRILEQRTTERLEEDIELIARAIQLPLSHALQRGHEGTVERALESAFSINRVYGIYVYDVGGQPIYSSGAEGAEMSRERAATLADRREQAGEFRQAGREEVFSFFVPLVDAGERVNGLLQITRRGSEFDEYIAEVRNTSLQIILGAGVLMGIAIFLAQGWWIARPILRMNQSLQRIENGSLSHRLDRPGPAELRALAVGINRMLDSIVASNDRLAEQRAQQDALQQQLYQSEKMAALGQLAAGVAHELGSPLSIIDGKVQQLRRSDDLPARVTTGIDAIKSQTRRMEDIIRQLLDYGGGSREVRRVRPDYPLKSVLDIEEASLTQNLDIAVCISPEVENVLIEVDPIRLEGALANLLRNGVQAAHTRLDISCMIVDHSVQYCFEDDGDGVSPEITGKIFEPFFTTKRPGEGTGLGLALAQGVASEHGGRIEFCNVDGGARFCLLLPLRSTDD